MALPLHVLWRNPQRRVRWFTIPLIAIFLFSLFLSLTMRVAWAHARLGSFRGFGTERARLGTWNPIFEISTQNEHLPAQRFFFLSFGRKSKNRTEYEDFEKKNVDPQLHQIFKPISKFFCTFSHPYGFCLM